MISMRPLVAVLALSFPLAARAGAQRPVAEQYAAALTFQQFVAGDSSHRDSWMGNYEHAPASVMPVMPRARAIRGHWHLFVIAESWCSDALASVPYLARLADEDSAFDLRLLRRADAQPLLQAHLLNGRAATPVVLLYDDSFVERGAWIERSAALRAFIEANSAKLDDDALARAIREWRARDAGRSVLDEVLTLLEHRPQP